MDGYDLLPLHLVSKHFYKTARDNELWRALVAKSSFSPAAVRRRDFLSGAPIPVPDPVALQLRAAARSAAANADNHDHGSVEGLEKTIHSHNDSSRGSLAPDGDVNFYHEYIARHSPISLGWLQNPSEPRNKHHHEIRGLAFTGRAGEIIVAPLDNDSICLWDLGSEEDSPSESAGRILARSKPGILSADGLQKHSKDSILWNEGRPWQETIVESVSVDKSRNRAYFAIGNGLNEVDLNTLQLVSHWRLPSSICALSEISHSDPLTVATNSGLHLHDYRSPQKIYANDPASECLNSSQLSNAASPDDFDRLISGDGCSSHAPLIHSPLSIVHLHSSQTIHVAGRFPSILSFDRRTFPKIHSTIHSGARLSSLTSKSSPEADTLIACGEYNGKGSLELYQTPTSSPYTSPTSRYQNRTSAARSKLLSVASHGTRIVFCDGDGMLKWVESDGHTLVRRWNINSFSQHESPCGLFGGPAEAGASDVARKMVPLNGGSKSELAIWTGERIGIVGFRKRARFGPWNEEVEADEDVKKEKELEGMYEGRMRKALERQADEVRFVRGLGLGI